jgi:lysophospholipid acyltransferase (LPLAT)-like uncharacterized protein
VLAVFWHGKYFPLFALAEGRSVTVFVGQSFRGEIIARLCRRFGFTTALLPAGEPHGYMHAVLQTSKAGALAVDGPHGPFHEVKPGLVKLAADLQLAIVPVSVASRPRIVLTRR